MALYRTTIALVVGALAVIAFGALAAKAGMAARRALLRRAFIRRYGVDVPVRTFAVRGATLGFGRRRIAAAGPDGSVGTYHLVFPAWRHARHDGSADGRRRDNELLWGTCALFLPDATVTCESPRSMVELVGDLRARGVLVGLCDLERARLDEALARRRRFSSLATARAIYAAFRDAPTGFERYCAELYRALGYEARTTPPANDGGYDVEFWRGDMRGIAECKCYAPGHPVGRPVVQKLVGANEVARAQAMVFITTSSFTPEALEYASSAGVDCVDGAALSHLWDEARKAWGDAPVTGGSSRVDARLVRRSWLSVDDLAAFYPPDVRP